MLSTIWGIITALPAIVKLVGQLLGIADQIRRAFQTDPVDQQKKENDAQKQAQEHAGQSDDTSGLFGGKSQ